MGKLELKQENIKSVLKNVYDPEIPVNIIDLGLVYEIEILPDNVVDVTMTLTAVGCPMVSEFMERIKQEIEENIDNVKHVNVDITFDPPWNPNMISEDALLELGISR